MRALILAAGFGTRLLPLTKNIPKCLVKIGNKPILQIWLENLKNIGINDFTINTHYLHIKVSEFIKSSVFSHEVNIEHEKQLLGTAGTLIKNINEKSKESLFLAHADNYTDLNLIDFVKAHNKRPKECMMTMVIFESNRPKECGIVQIDDNNIVIEFEEKPKKPKSNLANGAIYILSNEIQEILKKEYYSAKDFSAEVLNQFIGKIFTYKVDNLIDIGSKENLNLANNIVLKK